MNTNVLLLAATLAISVATAANAVPTLQMRLSGGGTTQSLIDTAHNGTLTYNGAIDNFGINVTTGVDLRLLDPQGPAGIDLNSIDVNSLGSGSLTIELTETGILGHSTIEWFGSQIGGTLTNQKITIEYSSFLDTTNAAFGTDTLLGTWTTNTSPFAWSGSTAALTSAEYSLTERIVITATGRSMISFDASVADLPEPASVGLLGLALTGTAVLRRSRRQPK
jgi:hypothetical protein